MNQIAGDDLGRVIWIRLVHAVADIEVEQSVLVAYAFRAFGGRGALPARVQALVAGLRCEVAEEAVWTVRNAIISLQELARRASALASVILCEAVLAQDAGEIVVAVFAVQDAGLALVQGRVLVVLLRAICQAVSLPREVEICAAARAVAGGIGAGQAAGAALRALAGAVIVPVRTEREARVDSVEDILEERGSQHARDAVGG